MLVPDADGAPVHVHQIDPSGPRVLVGNAHAPRTPKATRAQEPPVVQAQPPAVQTAPTPAAPVEAQKEPARSTVDDFLLWLMTFLFLLVVMDIGAWAVIVAATASCRQREPHFIVVCLVCMKLGLTLNVTMCLAHASLLF